MGRVELLVGAQANPIALRRAKRQREPMRKLLGLLLLTLGLHAEVTLSPLFTDHAVLQRDKPLPIWGWAEPGEHVTVTFSGQTVSATADAKGKWVVVLDALQGSSTGAELTAAGKNTLKVTDVVVGDVWLCSGQSNMEFPVDHALNAKEEIAAADNPLIRQLKVPQYRPESATEKFSASWAVNSPATVGNFTAVGYFFARDVQPRLGVPIGLINSTAGGSEIECWISAKRLENEPAFKDTFSVWKKGWADYQPQKSRYEKALASWTSEEAEAKNRHRSFFAPKPIEPIFFGPKSPPSSLFNGMINPLLPTALRGILWYQGEGNWYRPREYHTLFAIMIQSWRDYFAQGDLPFIWVQLPNWKNQNANATDWAVLRDEQATALALPNTGQAVTIDVGETNNLHPLNKQEVGRRLALIARANVYGMHVDYSGPIFESATREGTGFQIHFTHAGTGLTAEDQSLQSFQIAGFDRKFYPATARIQGDTVSVTAKDVVSPVAVRYAWFNDPHANLYNGAGLPAQPFRTDDW